METLGQHLRLATVDLIVEEQGQELDVAEAFRLRLGAADVEGLQHASQPQGLELGLELVGSHRVTSGSSAWGPWRKAPALLMWVSPSSRTMSRELARMFLTVR